MGESPLRSTGEGEEVMGAGVAEWMGLRLTIELIHQGWTV